jgi:hypothetical protein
MGKPTYKSLYYQNPQKTDKTNARPKKKTRQSKTSSSISNKGRIGAALCLGTLVSAGFVFFSQRKSTPPNTQNSVSTSLPGKQDSAGNKTLAGYFLRDSLAGAAKEDMHKAGKTLQESYEAKIKEYKKDLSESTSMSLAEDDVKKLFDEQIANDLKKRHNGIEFSIKEHMLEAYAEINGKKTRVYQVPYDRRDTGLKKNY